MKNRFDIKKKMGFALMFLIILSTTIKGAANTNDFDLILNNISSQNEADISIPGLNTNVGNYLSLLNTNDGSFSDINYDDQSGTNWQPIVHLDRLKNLVFAYTMSNSDYYQSEAIYENILSILDYWYQKHPGSSNWWNTQIAVPKSLGVSLIQMRKGKKQIPENIEQLHIVRLAADAANPDNEEGANLTDVATDYFYRACLQADVSALQKAINYAFSPLKLESVQNTASGIRFDYSFHQHGRQLYIGGYGEELIKGATEFAMNLLGSEYALKGDQLDALSGFIRNAYIPAVRGQYIHYNVMGRSLSRNGATVKTGFAKYINDMKTIDPTHAAVYDEAVKRMRNTENSAYKVTPHNSLFPISDYAQHTRTTYSFGVRAVSERTSHVEKGNGENLKGYFLSLGSTVTTMNGNEYRDIFPVWNWARIPGTTAPQVTDIPQRKDWGILGTGNFVGGVSDSLYATMTFNSEDVIDGRQTQAKKSWFMFDEEIVCLGSDITSNSSFPVNTTVEQSLLKSDVIVSNSGTETTLTDGEHSYSDGVDWVLHNRIGYFFPEKGNLKLINKNQSGNWKDINTTQADQTVSQDVFTLFFDHGTNPNASDYAYVIVPNKLTATAMKNHKIDNIEILANNNKMQVVEHRGLGMWMLVFFEAGKFTHSRLEVEVSKPAVIMLKNATTPQVTMHIADPAQTRSQIEVKTMIPSVSNKTLTTVCDLETLSADQAGFSKSFTIEADDEDDDKEIEVLYTIESPVLADTYVNGGATESTNFGKADNMLIKMNPVNYNREGYIKLSLADMGNLNNPDAEDVGKVELALTTIYTNESTDEIYWTLNPVEDTNWDENEMTYLTKPDFEDIVIAQHQGHVRGQGVKDQVFFDITDYARMEFAKGKTEIALRIYNNREAPDGKHDTKFASKEHPDANRHPKLVVSVISKAGGQKHSITLPELTGAEFDPESGEYEVETGNSFSFSIILDSGYSNSKPTVKANGVKIDPKTVETDQGVFHYELLLIEEDIEIEVENIEKNDFSLKAIRVNGEELDIEDAYYLVDCDSELEKLQVDLDVSLGAYTNQQRQFEVDVSKPMRREINIRIGSSEDQIENTYQLIIEKRFNFLDIVVPKFNRRLIANNNPATNRGYSFDSYTWYKNGVAVGEGQVYAEPNNETLDPTAQYQLVVKTRGENSMTLSTCPTLIALQPEARVYPVPANIGETVTIEIGESDPVGTIKVFNLSGVKVMEKNITNQLMTIQFKDAGIYIIQTEANGNATSHKIIIR